ncbi:MAG: hypothetical protein AAGD08_22120, partial [Pseudomonadota bacterium]
AALGVAGCTAEPATVFDTSIRYDGQTYMVREVRRAKRMETTLFQIGAAGRTKVGGRPGAVIHYTTDDIVRGLPSKDRLIRNAERDGDRFTALLFRVVRDGERLGEAAARETRLLWD